MKVYLCARYSRHPEMQEVAAQLASLDIQVTSRWINGSHDLSEPGGDGARYAKEDWQDLLAADALLVFSEHPKPGGRNRGGRHVEFGGALAMEMPIFVVGPRENVFHYLPGVQHCENLDAALREIAVLAYPE